MTTPVAWGVAETARLRDVGERTLGSEGFSVMGLNAIAFGALLMNAATEIERLTAILHSAHETRLEMALELREAKRAISEAVARADTAEARLTELTIAIAELESQMRGPK